MVKVKSSDKTEPTGAKPGVKTAANPAGSKTAAKSVKAPAKPAKAASKPVKPAKAAAISQPVAPPKPAAPLAEVTAAPVLSPIAPPAEPAAAEPKLVTSSSPVVTGPEMKKKELIEKVVKRSGVKKKDAKQVVEAMLAVLGESLTEGRELVLQPMGRLKTTRVKESGSGRVLICRLRQGGGEGKGGKEALAEDDD